MKSLCSHSLRSRLSLSLSLFCAMTFALIAQAQTCPTSTCIVEPAYFGPTPGAPSNANMGSGGDLTANSFASVNPAAGSIYLYPSSGSDYLSIQAPSSTMSNIITWMLPAGTPSANSFLLFSGGVSNSLAYTTFGSSGNVTPTFSSGMVNLNLSSGPNFSSATTFEVASNPVLQLASGGSLSSVSLTSAGSGGSPTLAVTSTATSGVPLTLQDFEGGGVNLESNGQIAFQAIYQTTSSTPDYLQAMAAVSGTGASPELIPNGPDPNINLALSAKGSGIIVGTSTFDLQANAITTELPVDSACTNGVTANMPAFMKTGGTALGVHTISAGTGCSGSTYQAHGYLGIAVFSRTSGQAVVATSGQFPCTFTGGVSAAGDYVAVSNRANAGFCYDTGTLATLAPPPPNTTTFGQVIGILASTSPVSTFTYTVLIKPGS